MLYQYTGDGSRQEMQLQANGKLPLFVIQPTRISFQGMGKTLLPLPMEHQLNLVDRRTLMRRNWRRAFLLRSIASIADGAAVLVAVEQDGPQCRRDGSG